MELEKAKEYLRNLIKNNDTMDEVKALSYFYGVEAIETVLQELDRLQRENDLAKKALIVNSYEADERNNLLVKIQELQKENEKLKEIDLTTVHIKGVCDEKERWRNKIREKIEELKENEEGYAMELQAKIDVLNELLKEE